MKTVLEYELLHLKHVNDTLKHNNMRKLAILLTFIFIASMTVNAQQTLHDFKVKTLTNQEFDMASLKGKKVMIVNTASKCGLTPQYKDIEALYSKYKDRGFVVIGFPANNFMNQEPGTNEEIAEFCEVNYGVTFPMMDKISVKGKDQHPVYSWLTEKSKNGKMDSEVKWNFQKYLINENGELVDVLQPREKADSEKVINWIEGKEQSL
jgi:glutathione peroxidase